MVQKKADMVGMTKRTVGSSNHFDEPQVHDKQWEYLGQQEAVQVESNENHNQKRNHSWRGQQGKTRAVSGNMLNQWSECHSKSCNISTLLVKTQTNAPKCSSNVTNCFNSLNTKFRKAMKAVAWQGIVHTDTSSHIKAISDKESTWREMAPLWLECMPMAVHKELGWAKMVLPTGQSVQKQHGLHPSFMILKDVHQSWWMCQFYYRNRCGKLQGWRLNCNGSQRSSCSMRSQN